MTADDATAPLEIVGSRYRLVEQIATGTTATVWRARDDELDADVAVKRMHPHLAADPKARQRFRTEAAAVAQLSHPGILSAIDIISTDGELAIIFPFVPGATLVSALGAGPIGAEGAAEIAADVAEALEAAHAAGFIHRDVKPANILLGDDDRVYLLDFGISRAVADASALESGLTGAGMAIGTLPYMAPEQLAAAAVTPAADMFGLGVVMYELLAGSRPFVGDAPLRLAEEHAAGAPPIVGAPAELVALATSLLNPEPSLRPTAGHVARTLRAWLSTGVLGESPTVVMPAVPLLPAESVASAVPKTAPVRRYLAMVTAAVAALVLFAVGFAVFDRLSVRARPEASAPLAAAGSAEPRDGESPGAAADHLSCSAQQVTAPEPGRWRLYQAEFGSHDQVDYLRLKLRHAGGHEQSATANAEVVAATDVAERFGIEPPSGADAVLVVAFNGPVGIGGPWGARPGNRGLREFRIERGREGNVHAVIGVGGEGCYRLRSEQWAAGETAGQVEIELEIARQ